MTLLVITGLFTQRFPQRWRLRRRPSAHAPHQDGGTSSAPGTEQRRVEELVRELEEVKAEFDRKIALVDDLLWTLEVLPDGEMVLTYISDDASGVVGQGIGAGLDAVALRQALRHPDDAAASDAFTAAMRAGRAAEVEERLVGYDGRTRWVWSRATPRREGQRLFVDGITTNITERHQLAEQREAVLQRERDQVAMLEELQRSRDDFIALAGHELRTPLTVIQGYTEHLLEDPTMTADQKAQLEIVVRRARLMSDLIDDLFDLAKLDAPLTSIAFRPVPLEAVVEDSVRSHSTMADERGITVECRTAPVEVAGDRPRLRRMVDNLLDNALKYSSAGGRVHVSLSRDAGNAVLEIADEGIGIPPEEVGRVFERLYRASNAIDLRYPGTGLGLSIVQATAVRHGGAVEAAGGPDGGTIVTVHLPLERPHLT